MKLRGTGAASSRFLPRNERAPVREFPVRGSPYYYRKGFTPSDPMSVYVLETTAPLTSARNTKGVKPAGFLQKQVNMPPLREQRLTLPPLSNAGVKPAANALGYSHPNRRQALAPEHFISEVGLGANARMSVDPRLISVASFGALPPETVGLP